jgi:hypothetical protein
VPCSLTATTNLLITGWHVALRTGESMTLSSQWRRNIYWRPSGASTVSSEPLSPPSSDTRQLLIFCIIIIIIIIIIYESPQRPGFASRWVQMGFLVHKVALGHVFLRVLRFSPEFFGFPLSVSFHRSSIFISSGGLTIDPLVAAFQRQTLTPSTWISSHKWKVKLCLMLNNSA